MSAELETRKRTRKKRTHTLPKKWVETPVRYRYSHYTRVKTPLVGTFRELWRKYKDKYAFYCADVPPGIVPGEDGSYQITGFQLGDYHLQKYGNHKAWLDSSYKVNGKPVILVFNAD